MGNAGCNQGQDLKVSPEIAKATKKFSHTGIPRRKTFVDTKVFITNPFNKRL